MWKQKANAQRARHSFKSNTHIRAVLCVYVFVVYTQTSHRVWHMLLLHSSLLFVALVLRFSLCFARRQCEHRGGKILNKTKKKRLKLLPKGENVCCTEGGSLVKGGGGGGNKKCKNALTCCKGSQVLIT